MKKYKLTVNLAKSGNGSDSSIKRSDFKAPDDFKVVIGIELEKKASLVLITEIDVVSTVWKPEVEVRSTSSTTKLEE